MSSLILADVSEYQTVDWNAYVHAGHPAAIIRAYNGNRADRKWTSNRASAHGAGLQLMGVYAYVVAGVDVAAQANAYADLVGPLKPNEFPICDIEEGSGDQSARAATWRRTVAARLARTPWLYSGASFYAEHNLSAAGYGSGQTWIAAYNPNPPASPAHSLWQFSDTYGPMAGISAKHDASSFNGTVQQLAALAVVAVPVTPPVTGIVPFPGRDQFGPGADNHWVTLLGQLLVRKGYGRFYHQGPSPRWSSADQAATKAFQLAQGWTGTDADGLCGPQTWLRLQE